MKFRHGVEAVVHPSNPFYRCGNCNFHVFNDQCILLAQLKAWHEINTQQMCVM